MMAMLARTPPIHGFNTILLLYFNNKGNHCSGVNWRMRRQPRDAVTRTGLLRETIAPNGGGRIAPGRQLHIDPGNR
ncbi:hypothetical protein BH23GEM9_BH23GEM9_17000 [soil metagenome]